MLIVCFFFKVLGDCLLGWGGLTNKQPISLSNLTNNYRAPTSCEASPITTTPPHPNLASLTGIGAFHSGDIQNL